MSTKKPSIKDRAMLVGQSLGAAPSAGAPSPAAAPPAGGAPVPTLVVPHRERPATGPGSMVRFLEGESKVYAENEALKKELATWESASPTRLLDPSVIQPSRWANRHEDSFTSAEFVQLKAEISQAGVNAQPIKVRPLAGTDPQRYEVVFGHRRHRACSELGLQVLAMIEPVDDRTLFEEMDRENRARSDLRPYEQGVMYARALAEGLYPSLRQMADAIGVDKSLVSKALRIAELPAPILDAFPSRLDLQYRWVAVFDELLAGEKKGAVLALAEQLTADRRAGKVRSSAEVFSLLAGVSSAPKAKPVERTVVGKRGSVRIVEDGGRVKAEFSKGALDAAALTKLDAFLGGLLEQ